MAEAGTEAQAVSTASRADTQVGGWIRACVSAPRPCGPDFGTAAASARSNRFRTTERIARCASGTAGRRVARRSQRGSNVLGERYSSGKRERRLLVRSLHTRRASTTTPPTDSLRREGSLVQGFSSLSKITGCLPFVRISGDLGESVTNRPLQAIPAKRAPDHASLPSPGCRANRHLGSLPS